MRVPKGHTVAASKPVFRAGAIYIEIENLSNLQAITIIFDGVDAVNTINIDPKGKRTFPLLGSQGYAGFTLTNSTGGNVDAAFVLIIN